MAALLRDASIRFHDPDPGAGGLDYPSPAIAEIRAPLAACDQLRKLHEADQKIILDAMSDVWDSGPFDPGIGTVVYRVDVNSLPDDPPIYNELLQEVQQLQTTMTDVSTGGPRIPEADPKYRELYERTDATLRSLGVENPNPYTSLWDWYAKWSSGDLPSYHSRRVYIKELFAPLERALREHQGRSGVEIRAEPTGLPRVDRDLGQVRKQLAEANSEVQFQVVGTLCRETLISLAQTVYDPTRHPPMDGVTPSNSDAKRMLDSYIATELRGKANEAARRHAKAALMLADALQHDRTATFRDAALCAEATASVVNIIAIVSGRRDPEPKA